MENTSGFFFYFRYGKLIKGIFVAYESETNYWDGGSDLLKEQQNFYLRQILIGIMIRLAEVIMIVWVREDTVFS